MDLHCTLKVSVEKGFYPEVQKGSDTLVMLLYCGLVSVANPTYSGYDAAVYNAATLYVAQQTAGATGAAAGGNAATAAVAAAAAATSTAGAAGVVNKIHQGGGNAAAGGGNVAAGAGGGWVGGYRKGPMLGGAKPAFRPKAAPKQQQVHYCEVCRISCAGPQV